MDENKDNILNQDSWVPATPDSVGGYLKIDLNKVDLVTYSLNKRFRQGENGAELKFWFYDGNIPHQLDPSNAAVTLYGEDSTGKIKVVDAASDSDWQSGRVKMYLPSQVFASAGQYKRMVIEVKNADQIIATINFNLDVLPNDFYNINIGSEHFSGQLKDEILKLLDAANEKAEQSAEAADMAIKKFKSDYDALNTMANNIKKLIDENDVVSNAKFEETITKMTTKAYKASDINWQDPFKSWINAGGTSLILRDGAVALSLSTITYSGGSTICLLPEECRPKSEKNGIGISMNTDGHDAQPVFISVMPDGRVIVQNNTHSAAKIIVLANYSLFLDESENNNSSQESIVENVKDAVNSPIVGVYQPTNIYAPDGTIGRALDVGQVYAVHQTGVMNGRNVARVAVTEWVYVDEVAYSYNCISGTITVNGTSQAGYHENGESYNMALTDGTPYVYDRMMDIKDKKAYRVATNQYLDEGYGVIK